MTPKAWVTRGKNRQIHENILKLYLKRHYQKSKRQPRKWLKIFANQISRGYISRVLIINIIK